MNSFFAGILAATVWISPNGNDITGDGSKEKPVATLQKAVDITRNILSDEDKKIIVKDGLYRFDKTVSILNGDAGLSIEAENKGKAVFTGARPVSGWKVDPKDKRFLVADFPFKARDGWTYSFVVNGKMATFSCFPQGVGRKTLPYLAGFAEIPKNNRRTIRYDRRTLPQMDSFKDLDLTSVKLFIPQEWASITTFIATNDWERGVFHLARGTAMPIGQFNQGYKIYNSRVGMTEPGCWMYSIGDNKIYYWPREGESLENINGEVSEINQILYMARSRDITLRGLVFEGCAKSDKMDNLNAAAVRGCAGALVEDCEFRHVAGNGWATYHDWGQTIRRNHAHHLGSVGFWTYGGGGTLFEENETHHLSTGLSFYSDVKVIRNHIHHTRGVGISAWSCDSLIASNHIHHTMLVYRDGGGLYGAQTRCLFIGNYCHDNGDWPGLYNDEGGQYTTYTGNVFEEDYWPFHMHDCYGITVTNNTFIGRNGMLFSFQGSTHCVFKDNVIRTAMPIDEPSELVNCDVWDNELQLIQPDGTVVTNRLVFSKKPEKPALPAQACVMSSSPVDESGKWTGKGFRNGRGVSCNRDINGINIPGVPGGGARFGFYGEWLYITGNYEYNKVSSYSGCYNNAGHIWGVNDGVRFLFKDFHVDVHFDGTNSNNCGTFIVSDGSFEVDDTFNAVSSRSAGAGGRRYRLRIPLKRLGIDPKNALGAKVPMNVIFYNGDHREYKYYSTPSKKGFFASLFGDDYDYLTGSLELIDFVRNNYSFVNLQEGTQNRPDRMPAGALRDSNQHFGINTVSRPGDDFRRDGKSGYDSMDEFVRGFSIRHREEKGGKWMQDFFILPFRDEDPSGDGVFTRKMDKAAEYCESGRNPGYYFTKFEEWQLGAGFTSSKNCAYAHFNHSNGGIMKLCLDTQDGPDGTVLLSEGSFNDGVFEGHNRVKGLDGKERDVYVKIEFGLKPVAVRTMKANGKKGTRYILDFMIKPRQKIFVKAAVSSKSLEDARAKFDADDSSKGFYDYSNAAKADWKAYFEAMPHEGTDAEHKKFYTDKYFELF
jgi:hypothetical protein